MKIVSHDYASLPCALVMPGLTGTESSGSLDSYNSSELPLPCPRSVLELPAE